MKISQESLKDLYQKILQIALDKHGVQPKDVDRIVLKDYGVYCVEQDIYAMGYFSHTEELEITAEDLEADNETLVQERLKREEEERILAEVRREEEKAKREKADKKRRFEEYQKLRKEFGE